MNKETFKYIKKTFLGLTRKTYPYMTEIDLEEEGLLIDNLEKDVMGNYFLKIGESRTLFASHLDTADNRQEDVVHIISKNEVVKTDGRTILGADDKAGVALMFWMIKHNIPGLYYFFVGEECGCIGSGHVAKDVEAGIEGNYDRVISFDRKGLGSIITYQSSYRTCSEEFSEALAKDLNRTKGFNYKSDNTGSYTDSAEFTSIVPECTNLSVGYYAQHTHNESQDLIHLSKLADALLLVNWEELPTKRNVKSKESKCSSSGPSSVTSGNYKTYDDYDDHHYSGRKSPGSRGHNSWNSSGRYPDNEVDEYGYGYDHATRSVKKTIRSQKKTLNQYLDEGAVREVIDPNLTKDRTLLPGQKTLQEWLDDNRKGEIPRSNMKGGKSYYSSGAGDLVELVGKSENPLPHKGEFDSIREKFLLSNISKQELKTVKEQYLDACFNDGDDCRYNYEEIIKLNGIGW